MSDDPRMPPLTKDDGFKLTFPNGAKESDPFAQPIPLCCGAVLLSNWAWPQKTSRSMESMLVNYERSRKDYVGYNKTYEEEINRYDAWVANGSKSEERTALLRKNVYVRNDAQRRERLRLMESNAQSIARFDDLIKELKEKIERAKAAGKKAKTPYEVARETLESLEKQYSRQYGIIQTYCSDAQMNAGFAEVFKDLGYTIVPAGNPNHGGRAFFMAYKVVREAPVKQRKVVNPQPEADLSNIEWMNEVKSA